MRNEKAAKKLLTFAGPRAWTTQEVMNCFLLSFRRKLIIYDLQKVCRSIKSISIGYASFLPFNLRYSSLLYSDVGYFKCLFILQVITLCERLAGQDANVTTVPVAVLRFTRQLTRFFQWTNDVADRLAFSEVTSLPFLFSLRTGNLYQSLWNLIEHFCKTGAVKRHSFLCSNERDLPASRGGCKWHPQLREVFTRLFHQHIEEIEGYQGAIQANWYILLTRWISLKLEIFLWHDGFHRTFENNLQILPQKIDEWAWFFFPVYLHLECATMLCY